MHWFGGSIAEAVTLSKQKNAIFVVFVEGDNDLTAEMTAVLDDQDILKRLANDSNFLAIKLQSGSVNYTHFAKIYQFVPVPSLFFIGRNGTPLEVVCAGVQADNLATRIDRILDEHYKDKPAMQPSTSGASIKEQTANLLQSEANTSAAPVSPSPVTQSPVTPSPVTPAPMTPSPVTPAPVTPSAVTPAPVTAYPVTETLSRSEPESSAPAAKIPKLDKDNDMEVVCDGDVCVRRPREAGTSQAEPESSKAEDTMSSLSAEEKVERAKELIEAKRREKADMEKQLEREKEKERRNLGQGVAELKKWQADQELKQIQEERKREKMENNLARQRILEQIAQDRAERRARDAPAPEAPATPTAPAAPTAGDGGERARIQFKLPDGSSHTAHFAADATLSDVTRHVADNLQLSPSQFTLWTAFPRRELTESTASLRALRLAPSAALVVAPRAAAARAPPGAGVLAFLTQLFTTMILEPSQQLYRWLLARLYPAPAVSPRAPSPRPGPGTPGARRRGNVHRITGDIPPDDDNNTWNGNSTQQM